MSRALFLFAPKFREFGVDVASALVESGAVDGIDGICTGGPRVVETICRGLGDKAGEIIDIEAKGQQLPEQGYTRGELAQLGAALPVGAFGRILTADRGVGAGFVLGGPTRPSRLKSLVTKQPVVFPETYCAHLLVTITALLNRSAPRFIFLYAHAGAVSAALCELAQQRNIPIFRFATSRTGSRFLIDSDALGLFSSLKRLRQSESSNLPDDEHRKMAVRHLEEFRAMPQSPGYSKFTASANSWRRLPATLARAALATGYAALVLLWTRDVDKWISVRRSWHNAANGIKRLLASENYFSREFPIDRRVVYFPLHVDPEASTMVLAPYHTNQIAVVEALAKALPADAVLVVKEHRPMKGLRPRGFYKTISSMPRVVLLSPDIDGLECVKRADLTAVVTGTAAWEAVRLRKPALIIGNSPYLQIGEGIAYEPCLADLPEAVSQAFDIPPASDEALIDFLAHIYAVSFELKTSLLWGRYCGHSEQERREATQAVVEKILVANKYYKNGSAQENCV